MLISKICNDIIEVYPFGEHLTSNNIKFNITTKTADVYYSNSELTINNHIRKLESMIKGLEYAKRLIKLPKEFRCDKCNRNFTSYRGLNEHIEYSDKHKESK